jgi:predicted flap endonuclease-1-like 5' DNA nuclease
MPATRKPRDELLTLPGVGPSLARDLRELGVRRIADLERRDPERLYARLNRPGAAAGPMRDVRVPLCRLLRPHGAAQA